MNGLILFFAMLVMFFLGLGTGSNMALGACTGAGEQGYKNVLTLYEGRFYCQYKKEE